eukprot:254388-Chlamydomonas_euryale.AAC.2
MVLADPARYRSAGVRACASMVSANPTRDLSAGGCERVRPCRTAPAPPSPLPARMHMLHLSTLLSA